MKTNTLNQFVESVRELWGPLNTELVEKCQGLLKDLVQARHNEVRLLDVLDRKPEVEILYRDSEKDFMLLAHTEQEGLYRVPHDHGAGWVIYAVLQGEVEMGTYKNITNKEGVSHLVRREKYRMRDGDCRVFLPGDVHDTLCISSSVVMLRFSSCDIKKEASEERMIRYLDHKR